MRQIVPDIYMMDRLHVSNVYLLVSDDELTLIDTGLASDAKKILSQMLDTGFDLNSLKRIILTHAHGDHVGGAAMLARISGAQIIAHRDDVPFIEKAKALPVNSFSQRMMNWMSDRIVFRLPGLHVDGAVEDGERLDVLGGLNVIHTPGHTPGSMCLYQPERQILFCGDTLFNANPVTRKPGLKLPMRLVSVDNDLVKESVGRLSNLPIQLLCCGHGEPIVDNVREKMAVLLRAENLR